MISVMFMLAEVPPGRVFGTDMNTVVAIVANLINFALLAFVMSWLLYRPVRDFLHNRALRIRGELSNAKTQREEAAALKLEYEQKLRSIEQEKNGILDAARVTAVENAKVIVAEAKKDAEALMQRATANIELEWERANEGMKKSIVEISALMTEKYLKREMDRGVQDRLFAEAVTELESELEEMAWKN